MLKEKIVLDTNCLVMSLSAHNPYAEIWQKFVKGEYILCVSNDILEEYEEDDNKFVDCAIASNAIFIVTEDKHFKELENIPFPKVEIVGIDDFLKHLKKYNLLYILPSENIFHNIPAKEYGARAH